MRYPCLIPKAMCKTDIHLVISREGVDEDGAPITAFEADLKCNYQDGGRTVLTPTQEYVKITGSAYFIGDICPEIPNITEGYAVIHGIRREIADGTKNRNPDGTVNNVRIRFK